MRASTPGSPGGACSCPIFSWSLQRLGTTCWSRHVNGLPGVVLDHLVVFLASLLSLRPIPSPQRLCFPKAIRASSLYSSGQDTLWREGPAGDVASYPLPCLLLTSDSRQDGRDSQLTEEETEAKQNEGTWPKLVSLGSRSPNTQKRALLIN